MNENEEFMDYNKIAAEFINLNIKNFIDLGKGIIKGSKESIQLKIKSVYSDYLVNIAKQYGKSKSFFIRDEPQELHSFYVPVGIESSNIKIKAANLRALLSHNTKTIISGTAGSGKSILLKHLLINSLNDRKQIPIFVELRDNNLVSTSLYDTIISILECFGFNLGEEFIKKAFIEGHFLLLLDGLDEVTTERRSILVKEIDNLLKEFSKTSIIITTRPDNIVSELQTFSIFRTLPLSLEQSIELVNKLPADESIKSKFIIALKEDLFERHSSFLSNPLLLTIMLLTYGYSTDIPNKLSVFYNQAFEALFQRHDTMKGAYKRVRETRLDIQDFGRILSVFCIQTYDDRKIRFSREEAISYIVKSKQLTNITFDNESFLNDLLQSVCILIEDGLFITFTHRSFQEYFAAKFIVSSDSAMKKRLLAKFESEITDDNVFKLVHELDCDFLEYEFLYPFLVKLFETINLKKKVGVSHYLKFLKIMWTRIYFTNGNLYATVNLSSNTNNITRFIFLNLTNSKEFEKFIDTEKSEWIKNQIEKSKTSQEDIIYNTEELKSNSEIVVELYDSKSYFSKKLLLILVKIKENLEEKKKNMTEKLEEFLFNEK